MNAPQLKTSYGSRRPQALAVKGGVRGAGDLEGGAYGMLPPLVAMPGGRGMEFPGSSPSAPAETVSPVQSTGIFSSGRHARGYGEWNPPVVPLRASADRSPCTKYRHIFFWSPCPGCTPVALSGKPCLSCKATAYLSERDCAASPANFSGLSAPLAFPAPNAYNIFAENLNLQDENRRFIRLHP